MNEQTERERLVEELTQKGFCFSLQNVEDLADWVIADRKRILHEMRMLIQLLPIKKVNYRWRIVDRNKNMGWNECRLEMFKKIGTLKNAGVEL